MSRDLLEDLEDLDELDELEELDEVELLEEESLEPQPVEEEPVEEEGLALEEEEEEEEEEGPQEPVEEHRDTIQGVPVTGHLSRIDDGTSWSCLSLGGRGVIVQGTPQSDVGEQFAATLSAKGVDDPGVGLEVELRVEVARSRQESGNGDELAVMALHFIDLGHMERGQIEDFVQRQLTGGAAGPDIAEMISDVLDMDVDLEDDFEITLEDEAEVIERKQPQEVIAAETQLGPYIVRDLLGTGGMGNVYLAEHSTLRRKVALKRLHAQYALNQDMVRRFFDEALLVNQIHHDNIVEITDFISEGNDKFFVMELLEGKSLADVCQAEAPLPLERAIHIALQLCDALSAVHEAGVIHRDLKPANIMLVERHGDPDFVKLLDFGIAKLRGDDKNTDMQKTATGLFLGTPGYMAPEQVLEGRVDHSSDIYAFGVLFYVMLTGRNPFVADTWGQLMLNQMTHQPPRPSSIRGSVETPTALEELVLSCLGKKPEDRPGSLKEVMQELLRIRGQLGSRWARFVERSRRLVRSAASPVFIIPVVLLAAAGVVAYLGVEAVTTPIEEFLQKQKLMQAPAAAPVATAAVEAKPAAEPDKPAKPAGDKPAGDKPAADKPEPGESEEAAKPDADKPAEEAAEEPSAGETAAVEVPEEEDTSPKKGRRKKRRRRKGAGGEASAPTTPSGGSEKPAESPAAPPSGESEAEQLYKKGVAQIGQNKALFAISTLQKCIRLQPRHALAHRALGRAYVMLGREKEAVQAFRNYLKLEPNNPDAAKLRRVIGEYERRQAQ